VPRRTSAFAATDGFAVTEPKPVLARVIFSAIAEEAEAVHATLRAGSCPESLEEKIN